MNLGLNGLTIPADNLSNNIGFQEKSEFSHIQQGGGIPMTLGEVPGKQEIPTTNVNNYLDLAMQQLYQNAVINSFGPGNNFGNCTNKYLKNQKQESCKNVGDDPKEDKDGMLRAIQQHLFTPQLGANGQLMIPALQAGNEGINHYFGQMLLNKFRNNTTQGGGGMGFPNLNAQDIGNMLLHNNLMANGNTGFMNNMGMAVNPNVSRSVIGSNMGNAMGTPSSLSSLSSSVSSMSTDYSSECSSRTSKGSCRRPNCFATAPFGTPGRKCLPTRGVTQPCPPEYRNGRGNTCVRRSPRQLRNMNKPATSGARSVCAEVNRGAKQAHDDFVETNCVGPGCMVKKVKGRLQCAVSK